MSTKFVSTSGLGLSSGVPEPGGGTEPELAGEAAPGLDGGVETNLPEAGNVPELDGGVEPGLPEVGDGAEPELAGRAGPELVGGGHSTRLSARPPTRLLRADVGSEELLLMAVPRTQSSGRSCLPPILSSIWRRP